MGGRKVVYIDEAATLPKGHVSVESIRVGSFILKNMGPKFDPRRYGYCRECRLNFVNGNKESCVLAALLGTVNPGNRLTKGINSSSYPCIEEGELPPCLEQIDNLDVYINCLKEK